MIPREIEWWNIIRMIAEHLQTWLTTSKNNNMKENRTLLQSDYWIPGIGMLWVKVVVLHLKSKRDILHQETLMIQIFYIHFP